MRKIHVVCPVCAKAKRIDLPPEVFDNDQGFLLRVPIYSGQICGHQFIAVLDYQFAIRDYETPPEKDFLAKYGHQKKPTVADFSFF